MNDEPAGFVVLNATSRDCAEILVMGIKKKFHRMGIGAALNKAYEAMAKKQGYIFTGKNSTDGTLQRIRYYQ